MSRTSLVKKANLIENSSAGFEEAANNENIISPFMSPNPP
jgi:hypothetical protein